MLPEMTSVWQETLNWQPNAEQQQQFQRLYELICRANQQLNLTRITEPSEFWEKHLWDSLRGIKNELPISNFRLLLEEDKVQSEISNVKCQIAKIGVIDIGTGAGFPGLPVAIAQPNFTVTLLDSTRKKIAFIETVLTELGIKNATTLTDRSEEVAKQPQHKASYDLALIRAVGSASVCAEYALPLLKNGGLAILYRGQWTDEESSVLQPILQRLGGKIESIDSFTTPLSKSVRHCVRLRKVACEKEIKNLKLKVK